MSDTRMNVGRAATEELEELKRRIKATRTALQSVRLRAKDSESKARLEGTLSTTPTVQLRPKAGKRAKSFKST
jgi:hypothetical protein